MPKIQQMSLSTTRCLPATFGGRRVSWQSVICSIFCKLEISSRYGPPSLMNKSCRNLKNQWAYLTSFQSYWNRRYLLFNNDCANCHVGDIPQRNVSGISQGEKSRKKRLMMDCESCQTYLLHSCSEV